MKEKEIQAKIRDEHYLRAIIVFELVGKPKEHIEITIKDYIENIKTDERIIVIKEDYAKAKELEDGMFTTFAEIEMLVEHVDVLTFLAINFAPASIEILEPAKIEFKESEITAWYNDLISKIHEISTVLRTERSVNKQLMGSLNALIKNSILLSLRTHPKSQTQIAKDMGIHEEQIVSFLKELETKKKIEKDGENYSLKLE